MPEIVPFEPVPRQSGATAGWWTMWEVTGGTERSALTIFLSDTGAVRPDIGDRMWNTLAETPVVESTTILDAETLDRLHSIATDYGYQQPGPFVPSLIPRLVVRVEP